MQAFFLNILKLARHRVFNKRTLVVEESIHVTFDETNTLVSRSDEADETDPSASNLNEVQAPEANLPGNIKEAEMDEKEPIPTVTQQQIEVNEGLPKE